MKKVRRLKSACVPGRGPEVQPEAVPGTTLTVPTAPPAARAAAGGVQRGALYVVATPLGNLGDITLRALDVLRGVDRVAAEDTRRTRILLDHYGIRTPLVALHAHNEAARSDALVAAMTDGQALALVSDAGTPLLADPGFPLVRAARQAGCAVFAVPGPCAAVAALSVSGLPVEGFVFVGFPPARPAARRAALAALAGESRTQVFYEAPHRIRAFIADLIARCGPDRPAVLCKELTKLHEASIGPALTDIAAWLDADTARTRGEFVVLLGGAPPAPVADDQLDALLDRLVPALGVRAGADAAAVLAGVRRNQAYRRALTRPCAAGARRPDSRRVAEPDG